MSQYRRSKGSIRNPQPRELFTRDPAWEQQKIFFDEQEHSTAHNKSWSVRSTSQVVAALMTRRLVVL